MLQQRQLDLDRVALVGASIFLPGWAGLGVVFQASFSFGFGVDGCRCLLSLRTRFSTPCIAKQRLSPHG